MPNKLIFLLLFVPYLLPYALLAGNPSSLQQDLDQMAEEYDKSTKLENERAIYQSKLMNQARDYRKNTLWERYFFAAPGFGPTARARTRIYYQAAFIEAEKHFAAHPREAGIENRINREDLFSLCNSMLDPYMNTSMPGGERLPEANQALIRKRIWKLYEHAFKPNFQATKRAQLNFEEYKSLHKIP